MGKSWFSSLFVNAQSRWLVVTLGRYFLFYCVDEFMV